MRKLLLLAAAPLLTSSAFMVPPALSQAQAAPPTQIAAVTPKKGEAAKAQDTVANATAAVHKMRQDSKLDALLTQAKGVLIVPDFAKGAVVVGGEGGNGVLLAHQDGKWSKPAFYDLGGISLGAQLGGQSGTVALILMSDKAIDAFKQGHNFSINAKAGLNVVDYSAAGQVNTRGDVIAWTDLKGLYAGATIGAADISVDDEANHAFYGNEQTSPNDILSGDIAGSHGQVLQQALPS